MSFKAIQDFELVDLPRQMCLKSNINLMELELRIEKFDSTKKLYKP